MYTYLRQHPKIFMPDQKEPHFFGSDLQWIHYTPPSIEEYFALFSNAKPYQKVGEASVYYLYSKKAPFEIHAFAPKAKIIIMLRNPIDMMYSLHGLLTYNLQEDITDFQEALKAENDRKQGKRIPPQCAGLHYLLYKDVARFYEQVKRYFDVFGRDHLHVIIYDDFKKHTAKVYRETLQFLGVSEDFEADFKVVNVHKVARSKKVMQWVSSSSPVVSIVRKLVPQKIRRKVGLGIVRLNTKHVPRPPLSPEVREELVKEFYAEIVQLSHLLERDLTHWVQLEGDGQRER